MKNERALEVINNMVNYLSCGNNVYFTIEELIKCGLTAEELVNDFGFSISDVEAVTGETLTQPSEEKKTYRVWAKTTSWAYLDVKAANEIEAYNIASETDGGIFINDDSKGDWEVDPDNNIQEVNQ